MTAQFDYDQAIADAAEIIRFFGMAAVLRRDGIDDRPCTVAIIEFNPREKPADLANPTDRKVIMAADNVEVQETPPDNELDKLVTFVQPASDPPVEDEVLPMTCKPKKTAPAGRTVIWEFTVRQ